MSIDVLQIVIINYIMDILPYYVLLVYVNIFPKLTDYASHDSNTIHFLHATSYSKCLQDNLQQVRKIFSLWKSKKTKRLVRLRLLYLPSESTMSQLLGCKVLYSWLHGSPMWEVFVAVDLPQNTHNPTCSRKNEFNLKPRGTLQTNKT